MEQISTVLTLLFFVAQLHFSCVCSTGAPLKLHLPSTWNRANQSMLVKINFMLMSCSQFLEIISSLDLSALASRCSSMRFPKKREDFRLHAGVLDVQCTISIFVFSDSEWNRCPVVCQEYRREMGAAGC